MWIYEHQNWTDFTWDHEIINPTLSKLRYKQGLLIGKMENLGFELKNEANLKTITNDVINSSAIEGEKLDHDEVRSSIALRLGVDIAGLVTPTRKVEGIVEIMLDATQKFDKPLTKERLFAWHSALFPTGRSGMHEINIGSWRDMKSGPMQIVSGPIGKEKVHFEAPLANILEKEMDKFLKWFEESNSIDCILKAAISHLWFVTLHPFEDGNGRISRTIADMALARAEGIPNRFYSMSSQIESERKNYYNTLERQQRSTPNITTWLIWFLNCLECSIDNAEISLKTVLYKADLWDKINQSPVNERQKLIINKMLENDFKGYMNSSKYAKLAKCSTDTSLRDIKELIQKKIFIQNQNAGGRSTSYRLI